MTDTAELRRLLEEATPGPWSVDRHFVVGPRLDTDDQSHGMINGVADIYGPNRSKDAALIVAMRNALPELLKALETTDELIEALAIYGFPVSDAAETALFNRGAGSREAQRLHKAAKSLIAARKALPPHGGVDVG